MNNLQKLATASWAIPLVYAFVSRAAGLLIGRLADMLVFVVAVAGVLAALFCLALVPRYGRKGILAPAIAGLLLSGIILAIWIPNFLAARERARSRAKSVAIDVNPTERTFRIVAYKTAACSRSAIRRA